MATSVPDSSLFAVVRCTTSRPAFWSDVVLSFYLELGIIGMMFGGDHQRCLQYLHIPTVNAVNRTADVLQQRAIPTPCQQGYQAGHIRFSSAGTVCQRFKHRQCSLSNTDLHIGLQQTQFVKLIAAKST